MKKTILGRTNIEVTRTSFGALPIQRLTTDEAVVLLRKAYDNGITFYDSARGYSDSEEKLGIAFKGIRENIIIATKTHAKSAEEMWEHLAISLEKLQTNYIDVYQMHNPKNPPVTGDEPIYKALLHAKEQGKIRHIGITSHIFEIAEKAVESGLYDTLQFPFSCLSSDDDIRLMELCRQKNVGFIAMKALSGGLITNAKAAFAFLNQYENVVPIWGIQHEWELDEFIALDKDHPLFDDDMKKVIADYAEELKGNFCRGCGYCLPCPVDIPINMSARMIYLVGRAPWQNFITDKWRDDMLKVEDCIECGECSKRCPYDLDTPQLIKDMLSQYKDFYLEKTGIEI